MERIRSRLAKAPPPNALDVPGPDIPASQVTPKITRPVRLPRRDEHEAACE